MKQADVLGDDTLEVIVALPEGAGVEIRDQAGNRLTRIATDHYLTDFGAVKTSSGDKADIVLYTYPDENQGGTFLVATADRRELARWHERPAPGRLAAGNWGGRPALFYLQGDALVVRSPLGSLLARLPAPEGRTFRDLYVAELSAGRTVVVASGNGYTPYHMVCVYDAGGQRVFQEINNEHAFDVKAEDGDSTFVVYARSSAWRYAVR